MGARLWWSMACAAAFLATLYGPLSIAADWNLLRNYRLVENVLWLKGFANKSCYLPIGIGWWMYSGFDVEH